MCSESTVQYAIRHTRAVCPCSVLGFSLRFLNLETNGKRVGTIIARLAVRLETCGLHVTLVKTSSVEYF